MFYFLIIWIKMPTQMWSETLTNNKHSILEITKMFLYTWDFHNWMTLPIQFIQENVWLRVLFISWCKLFLFRVHWRPSQRNLTPTTTRMEVELRMFVKMKRQEKDKIRVKKLLVSFFFLSTRKTRFFEIKKKQKSLFQYQSAQQ